MVNPAAKRQKKSSDADDKKKIKDAADHIRKKLDDSGWLDTVSASDLKQITSKLKDLKPAQRNQVIGELSDAELHKWADEIGSPWLGTGLDGGQKQELFNMLVPSLDQTNLVRLGMELTKADEDTATNEFILSVAMKSPAKAQDAYLDAIASFLYDSPDEKPEDDAFDKQQDLLFGWDPRDRIAEIINGKPDRQQLMEIKNLLEGISPKQRAAVFGPKEFEHDPEPFSPEAINKLAERITSPDPGIRLSDREKKELFDALSASMTGKQLAEMQTALTGHDFMQAIDANIRLRQKTGHAQPMGSTDELGKTLENYTNKQSLQRAANDPTINPAKRWAAKYLGPLTPTMKAQPSPYPVSPNGELFLQSLLQTNKADPETKLSYTQQISQTPVNPAQEEQVKAYNLDLAQTMVAEHSAATAYNSLSKEEKVRYGNSLRLVADITNRLGKIKNTDYYSAEWSTEDNSVSDALWLVDKYRKHVDDYSKEFGVPAPLLSGILAAEVKFDTPFDVKDPRYEDTLLGIGTDDGAFRAHYEAATDAVVYLSDDKVKKDLRDAHIDGLLKYLDTDSIKKHAKLPRHERIAGEWFDDAGPLGTRYAALITMSLAHQMWDAGRKNPASKTSADFGDFLKNMSAPQMASIYRGYRAGTGAHSGGYDDYDAKLGLHKVKGGEDFARAVKDPRAVMGYQAYQSEPYFEYYLNTPLR
jgi:hypothetical protein